MLTDHQTIELIRSADPVPETKKLPEPRRSAIEFLGHIDEDVTMRTLTPPVTSVPSPTRRRRLRPITAFAAALILVLGTVGIVALLAGRTGNDVQGPVATSEAPATTATSIPSATTPTPTTESPTVQQPGLFAGGAWTSSQLDVPLHGSTLTSLGLVAAGDHGIWISSDGLAWHQVFSAPWEPLDPQPSDLAPGEIPFGTTSYLNQVVEYRGAVYVLGQVITRLNGEYSFDQYVWRSENGSVWEQIPLPSGSLDTTGIAGAVVAGDTLLAWLTTSTDAGTSIIRTTDGSNWEIVTPETSGLAGVGFDGIVAYRDRFFAIGSANLSGGEDPARLVYTSDTGESWQPGPVFAENVYPSNVSVYHDTLYLGGVDFDSESTLAMPGLWRSTDGGTSFQQVELPADLPRGPVQMVTPTQQGLVVLSYPYTGEAPSEPVVLVGDDQTPFQLLQAPQGLFTEGQELTDIVQFGESIVMVVRQAGTTYAWTWSP